VLDVEPLAGRPTRASPARDARRSVLWVSACAQSWRWFIGMSLPRSMTGSMRPIRGRVIGPKLAAGGLIDGGAGVASAGLPMPRSQPRAQWCGRIGDSGGESDVEVRNVSEPFYLSMPSRPRQRRRGLARDDLGAGPAEMASSSRASRASCSRTSTSPARPTSRPSRDRHLRTRPASAPARCPPRTA
jgi:hypothetical protein